VNDILVAGAIMLGVASFFGVVLAVANRYLSVYEDPRVAQVEEMLPGTNCGACGQPGCHAFAEVLVGGEASPGQCSVSSADGVEAIAGFLGVDAGFQERQVARLHCAGGKSSVRRLGRYRGLSSCRAAALVSGGERACAWGCLGLADCESACGFGAIRMNAEALPVVNVETCTACGDCVDVCPLDLFTLEPVSTRAIVQCNSPLAGEEARSICSVACDACGRCAADAEPGAIEMAGGLPEVRAPLRTVESCTYRCPTGAIRWVEGNQFQPLKIVTDREVAHG
jgi:RnfABCDGE-type electron transport complex B subunit